MIHLGSIRKTSIDVDYSFLILAAFFVFSFYDQKRGIQYALLWVPVLFLSVLLHELAHAGMIGLFGYGASQVMLAGLGGVTLNKRVAKPWHDMVISAAGPAASFVIAVWISFIVGIAVIAFGVWVKYYMLSFLVAWYLWMNWQQWQYFRTHGFPGD